MALGVHHLGLSLIGVFAVLGIRASVQAFASKKRAAAKRVMLWGAGIAAGSTAWFVAAVVPSFALVASEAPQRSAILARGMSEPGTVLLVGWCAATVLFAAGVGAWVFGNR